jgi:hypothetical protein
MAAAAYGGFRLCDCQSGQRSVDSLKWSSFAATPGRIVDDLHQLQGMGRVIVDKYFMSVKGQSHIFGQRVLERVRMIRRQAEFTQLELM